jgi:hypothetical protein
MDELSSPGLYFVSRPGAESPAALLERTGPFHAASVGRLTSRAARGGWHLLFDGILTHERVPDQTDAEAMLNTFLDGGFDALHALEGFYNVLLLQAERGEAHLFSDPLCTRSWYLYQQGNTVAAAPTPLAFAAWELPMSLDRGGLFDTLRFMHGSLDRTLVQEVERLLPGTRYTWKGDAPLQKQPYVSFEHCPDLSITLEESAERLKTFFAEVMRGTLTHPRLESLPVHLPLTAGLDSRHILGELLDQDRPPEALRHVRFRPYDYEPARQIAEGLDLPMLAPPVARLDWPRLVERWMRRSAGLVNVHQAYLLEMTGRVPSNGAIGFNGYLMDWLMAVSPLKALPPGTTPAQHVWDRHKMGRGMLALLLPDASSLAEDSLNRLRAFAQRFEGPRWYRAVLLIVHQRGLHYTGPMDPMFADDAFYFSPGAHVRSLRYFQTVPRAVGGDRRARLEAMRRYFPELAAYPNADGHPYDAYDVLMKSSSSWWSQYGRPWLEALRSGFRDDPAPGTEHAWLRQIPALRSMHRVVARDSALARDGHLRGRGARASWGLLRAGGYQAWTLMSLLTAETAYRLLVRQEPLRDVTGWLFQEEGRRRTADDGGLDETCGQVTLSRHRTARA